MWPNPQFPADLVTFTEKIFNRKLHILCRTGWAQSQQIITRAVLRAQPKRANGLNIYDGALCGNS